MRIFQIKVVGGCWEIPKDVESAYIDQTKSVERVELLDSKGVVSYEW